MTDRVKVSAASLMLATAVGMAQGSETQVLPSQEQVQAVEQSLQNYVHPDPEIPTPKEVGRLLESVEDKDRRQFEQKLTDMFDRGEYAAVRRTIAERRAQSPDWQPPGWLVLELDRAETRAKIAAARNDPGTLIALHQRYPEYFSCREHYHLWSLADAHLAVGTPAAAVAIHHQMLASCSDTKLLMTTLDRIAGNEGPGPALAGAAQLEGRRELKLPKRELEKRRYGWQASQAVILHGEGRLEEAGTHLATIESGVIARRDLGLARLIAWNYRERGQTMAAVKWFQRVVQWSGAEEDRLHLLQLQWDANEHPAVLEALRQKPLRETRGRLWAAEVLRGEAAHVFDARGYAEAVELLDAALAYDKSEPTSLTALRGWACLELERYPDAHRAFAAAYRETLDVELASGLLYTAHRGGDWAAVLAVAGSAGGPVLAHEEERAIARRLAEGELVASQVTVENGRLTEVADPNGANASLLSRAAHAVEGFPGFTWGSIDDDLEGHTSASFLLNQGIDWVKLPWDITLGTYLEYRAINNDWRYFRDETEGALGIELRRSPFRLGAEYLPKSWRNGDDVNDSDSKAYLSWYHDWYNYLRRRHGGGTWNPLNVDAYAGATYGRITHDLDGDGGTSILGFVRQGLDWFTFADDITFHTYAAYRFRFRDWDNYWYDAHGPAIGVEFQKPPFALGVDYAWKRYPEQNVRSEAAGLYLNWYYGWDLKPR